MLVLSIGERYVFVATVTVCTALLQGDKQAKQLHFRMPDVQKHAKSRDHRSATEAYAIKLSGATVPAGFIRLTMNKPLLLL